MKRPRKLRGGVQEEEQAAHHHAARQHWNRAENPEEEGEGHVERPQAERPEEAAPVQAPRGLLRRDGPRHRLAHEEAGVRVVPDGLHVAEEGEDEAEQEGEVFDGAHHGGRVAVDEGRGGRACGGADEDADEGAEADGGGGQHGGRHDVVPQRLHRQIAVPERVLLLKVLGARLRKKQATHGEAEKKQRRHLEELLANRDRARTLLFYPSRRVVVPRYIGKACGSGS
ncbi:hypothetical protein GW17_00035197 [Ensete ventricosum]|nr:hypothetical protein GW17_00035197 [Ensete ventricosum]